MDLFEYQGKLLFARYGIPVSPGAPATTVAQAVEEADALGYPVVVKAQVQVGGRGKAGGIKLAADSAEVRTHAEAILGMDIKGHTVEVVWIEKASDIAEEYYASFTLDRAAKLHLGHALGAGRRGDRAGRRREPRRHLAHPRRSRRRAQRGAVPRMGRGGEPEPGGQRRRRRSAAQPLSRLHRRRRRPGGDQPADPHARRSRARARRQGHARRQRGLPPPRLRRVRRHPGARHA